MSYSFSVRGATKAIALQNVVAQLDEVVAAQPIHAADRSQAQAAAIAFLALVPDDAGDQDFFVSVHGSVGWQGDNVIISASVGVSAYLVAKE